MMRAFFWIDLMCKRLLKGKIFTFSPNTIAYSAVMVNVSMQVTISTCRFGDEEGQLAALQPDGPGPILSTALVVACYWACSCGYAAFLFIPVYDDKLNDFEVKVCS